ncbi:MAG TPA: ribose 5-phosphate isomerase A [Candidatus Nitrosocosmicus sp.]|nr:ribose 5-phosphate isomerase A [Candidatus Nitrosocosmicus sp.]
MSVSTASTQNNGTLDNSIENIAKDIIEYQFSDKQLVIGLGSGRAVTKIVKLLPIEVAKNCEFICTSLQIKIEAERKNLKIIDESQIPLLDFVIDGADQIDDRFCLIKGGGGALLREKILYFSAKKTIIVADFTKFVSSFSRSVPLEILPFGRTSILPFVQKLGGTPMLRTLDKGYPYVTENGNLILDVTFNDYSNTSRMEIELKKIPGIIETGLFNQAPDLCYCALKDNQFRKYDPASDPK